MTQLASVPKLFSLSYSTTTKLSLPPKKMIATADDLNMSAQTIAQTQRTALHHHGMSKSQHLSSGATSTDLADEIQVIEDQQTAINIRASPDRKECDRHIDLDIGSVHSRKPKSSPLFERRRLDDLDLLIDSVDSSMDESHCGIGRDSDVRGRGRRTKPLIHPQQTSSPHVAHQHGYDAFGNATGLPDLSHHLNRHYAPSGCCLLGDNGAASRLTGRERSEEANDSHARHIIRANAKQVCIPPPIPSGLEHDATVFENFEDVSPISSSPDLDQENTDYFDPNLHFVRPAMPICANPGAFAAMEPNISPSESSQGPFDASASPTCEKADTKQGRMGHHRAVSEMLFKPLTCAAAADLRTIRRRATIGSEATYRPPSFSRRGDQSA